MNYREWRSWFREQPWSLKWFLVLVLIRPALDLLYFLKEVSPFLSPLYIIGVATPVLILFSFFSQKFPRTRSTLIDLAFVLLTGLFLFNSAAVLTLDLTIPTLEVVFKLMTPVLIYFFVRHLIRSQRDLDGLLVTFLVSTIVPIGMLLYESLVSPFGSVVNTREFDRFNGLYADVMSYAIYVMGAFLIVCYFFIRSVRTGSFKKSSIGFGLMVIVTLLCLVNMHHGSSWAVFAGVGALLVLHLSSLRTAWVLLFVAVVSGVAYFVVGEEMEKRVTSMYSTELAILDEEESMARAFHGRGYRWMSYFKEWKEYPIAAKVLGISVTSSKPDRSKLLSGSHNDYMRVAFSAGLIGLAIYLLLFLMLFRQALLQRGPERFLILGAMAVVLLYSVTTTPTMYAPLMYLCLPVFAFAVLGRTGEAEAPVWSIE